MQLPRFNTCATHTSPRPDQGPDEGSSHYEAKGPLAAGRPRKPIREWGPTRSSGDHT